MPFEQPGSYDDLKNKQRQSTRDLIALLCALLLHALAWSFIKQPIQTKKSQSISLQKLSPSQFQNNRLTRQDKQALGNTPKQKLKQQQKEEQEKKQLEDLKGQVVDLPKEDHLMPNPNARFLSESNTQTDKETKSRYRTKDYKKATHTKDNSLATAHDTSLQEGAPQAQQAGTDKTVKNKTRKTTTPSQTAPSPSITKKEQTQNPLNERLARFREQYFKSPQEIASTPAESSKKETDSNDTSSGNGSITLPQGAPKIPHLGVLSKLAGAPSNDHLPDNIADGEGTFLNAREFKYAPFFNRLKQSVGQHWNPSQEIDKRDPTGQIYGIKTRYTVLKISLNENGELKDASVLESSGVDFLDQEAIAAFRRAQPFQNPPKQLIKNGIIEFSFGFHVEFNSGRF